MKNCRLLLFLLLMTPFTVLSQHHGYIFAEVVLKNKQVYNGQVKWSGGQVFWSDVLVAAKQNSHYLKYLDDNELNRLHKDKNQEGSNLDWQFMSLWKDKYPQRKTEVLCRFGDMARIHVTGNGLAQIYFKNGTKLRVTTDKDKGQDIGGTIILTDKAGEHSLRWEQISNINFESAPSIIPRVKGRPLYGTITTSIGPLTGYLQWSAAKYSDHHFLKGRTAEGKTVHLKFYDIRAIEKSKSGAVVEMKSGRKLILDRVDDLSAAHHGLVAMHPSWGKVEIDWKAFRSVVFEAVAEDTGYGSYAVPRKIYGMLKTKDQQYFKGNCVFDMDEEWNFDLLEGRKDGISYQIPFRYIRQITPLNAYYTKIVLQSDKVLVLGHHNDVTARNWGAIVWQPNSQFKYIPWNNIAEIGIR